MTGQIPTNYRTVAQAELGKLTVTFVFKNERNHKDLYKDNIKTNLSKITVKGTQNRMYSEQTSLGGKM